MADKYQVLRDLGIEDPEAYLAARRERTETRNDALEICSCGHTKGAHKGQGIRDFECSQGRINCPCKAFRPVVRVSNAKYFRFLSKGHREDHALQLGIEKSVSDEKIDISVEWINPPVCDVPGCTESKAAPYGFNKRGELNFEWAVATYFICSTHMRDIEQTGYHPAADAIRASFGIGPVNGNG